MVKTSLFSYKAGNSFLHKCPSWCKILFIPLINILFLCIPPLFSVILIMIQFFLAGCLHFTIKEQYSDLRPVIYYAILVFILQFLSWCFGGFSVKFTYAFGWENEKNTIFLLIKIIAIMQSVSLIFKTSTSLELRDGIYIIESTCRKKLKLKNKATFTNIVSTFLNFIPIVSEIWEQSKKAWYARGGKQSIRMYIVLLPVLFSIGMKKAFNTVRAISIRM